MADTLDFPAPDEGFVVTHFLVVSDQDRSRRWYSDVLGARAVLERDPVILRVANTWIILNDGGGPTEDKPDTTLAVPEPGAAGQCVPQHPGRRRPPLLRRVARGRPFCPSRWTGGGRSAAT